MSEYMMCECGCKLSAKARTCWNCDEMFNEDLEAYIEAIEIMEANQ